MSKSMAEVHVHPLADGQTIPQNKCVSKSYINHKIHESTNAVRNHGIQINLLEI